MLVVARVLRFCWAVSRVVVGHLYGVVIVGEEESRSPTSSPVSLSQTPQVSSTQRRGPSAFLPQIPRVLWIQPDGGERVLFGHRQRPVSIRSRSVSITSRQSNGEAVRRDDRYEIAGGPAGEGGAGRSVWSPTG